MPKKSTRRILYIITKSVWGGANRYVFDLATNLSGKFKVSIAAGGKEKFYQKIKETDIPYYDISNFQRTINPFKDIFAFFEVLSLIFQIKPDIIHVNSPKAGGIVGVAAWFYKLFIHYRLCLVYTSHGWTFSEDRPKWQIFLIKLFSKITCFFYDKIICVSQYDRKIALKNKIATADKLTTIYNSISPINFLAKEQAQKKLINKISPLVVGTVAEWTKNKGLIYLLKALEEIKEKEFDAILIGSGENPDKEKMYRLVEKNKNIYLIEWIDNAASYLKAFDIFVLPSLKEGLPYTILEAMLAETPIIATNVGGIPEMIENNVNGILIQSKNSQQLAEKILYLINNPEKAVVMAQKARKKVEKKFSLEKMIKKTKAMY